MTPALHQRLNKSACQLSALAALMVVAVLIGPRLIPVLPKVWVADTLRLSIADHQRVPITSDPGVWKTRPAGEIGWLARTTWMLTEVDLTGTLHYAPPYALYLSGPWSGEIYWDGELLGAKGIPGDAENAEQPGPIDTLFFLADSDVAPGIHQLAMRISTDHLGYQAATIFHSLSVGPYRDDARRDLRYYTLPLLLSGGFLILMVHFMRVWRATGQTAAWLLALFAFSILGQLVSEISRSLVDYSYDWHLWRSVGIFGFALLGAVTFLTITLIRTRTEHPKLWIAGILLLAIFAGWLESGFDNKTVRAIQICALGSLLVQARSWSFDMVAAAGVALALCWLIGSLVDQGGLLDSTCYFGAMIYLSYMSWGGVRAQVAPRARPVRPAPAAIIVKYAGRSRSIDASDVVAVKADGNYSQLLLAGGETVFHHQRLGQVMRSPPVALVRVHKSYAINLQRLQALRSQSGSRYQAELSGGINVPVSRYQVRELRERMAVAHKT